MPSERAGLVLLTAFIFSPVAWAQPLAGSEFQVNTHTTSVQHSPSVSFAPSGEFVVA